MFPEKVKINIWFLVDMDRIPLVKRILYQRQMFSAAKDIEGPFNISARAIDRLPKREPSHTPSDFSVPYKRRASPGKLLRRMVRLAETALMKPIADEFRDFVLELAIAV